MATILVQKKSVVRQQDKLYNITVNLSVKEGTIELLNRDFSFRYRTGDNVNKRYTEILKEMQEYINNYKAEQVLLNATAITTVVNNLQTNLTY
jgi:hypothetical protein